MNKDQVKGAVKVSLGKAQEKLGEVTSNTGQQVKGLNKEIEGKVQRTFGDAKEMVKDVVKKA